MVTLSQVTSSTSSNARSINASAYGALAHIEEARALRFWSCRTWRRRMTSFDGVLRMPTKQSSAASDTSKAAPAKVPPVEDTAVFECYCGLGTACPAYRQMDSAQRAACSCDKRQTAQWMFVNGMKE